MAFDTDEPNSTAGLDRREIPSRDTTWAAKSADLLHRAHLTPNQISIISVLFSLVAATALVLSAALEGRARILLLIVVAAAIPLRLLCNMLDGMLAVEKKMHTPTGDLFNELPDRIADVLVLAGAGYACANVAVVSWAGAGVNASERYFDIGVSLGWLAAVLAVLTAYVRTLGAAQGVKNFFAGPMAKPTRMWVIVLAALIAIFEPSFGAPRGAVFLGALIVISLGSLITVVMRLRLIVAAVRAAEVQDAN